NDPANKSLVKAILLDLNDPAPGSGGTASTVSTGMTRARVAAGVMPALRFVGILGLSATAFDIGWRIGSVPGSYVYERLTGNIGTPSAAGRTYQWFWNASLATTYSGTYPGVPTSGWVLQWDGQTVWASATGPAAGGAPTNAAGAGAATAAGATVYESTGAPGNPNNGRLYVMTEAAMEAKVAHAPMTSTAFAALVYPHVGPNYSGFNKPTSLTDTQLGAGLAAIGANDATDRSSSDPPAEQAVDAINKALDPSYSPDTFTMPNCVGLTYTACTAALTAAGFTGTAVYTALSLAAA